MTASALAQLRQLRCRLARHDENTTEMYVTDPNGPLLLWDEAEDVLLAALGELPASPFPSPERDGRCWSCAALLTGPHGPGCRAHEVAEARRLNEAERTVKSIATMLGWENVPPREILEREINVLKARAGVLVEPHAYWEWAKTVRRCESCGCPFDETGARSCHSPDVERFCCSLCAKKSIGDAPPPPQERT
jgi:hypothetical protein